MAGLKGRPPDLTLLNKSLDRGRQDIVFFADYFLGMKLHPGQIRFMRGATGNVNVLVPGNRFGKTVILAIRHIWHNFYKIGMKEGDAEEWQKVSYRTVALAPHSNVLEVDFQLIKQIMTSSFPINKEGEPIKTNKCRLSWYIELDKCRNSAPYFIQFRDNTGIMFASTDGDKGGSVQGRKFGYGSYDEGGRSHHLEYELMSNLLPRFAEMGAQLDIASTPDQTSPSIVYHSEIFEKGQKGVEGFKSFEGSAFENIFLPESYFEQIEETYGNDPLKQQVLYGKFVFAGDTLYPAEDIKAAKDESLNSGVSYEHGHKYVIGIDTAMGEDEMVYSVLDVPEKPTEADPIRLVRQMAVKGNSKSPQVHMDDFIGLVATYEKLNNVKIILETWNGESARFYQDMPYHLQHLTKCFGSWQPPGITPKMVGRNPRNVKKAEILLALRKLLANKSIKIPNETVLIQQLSVYREDDAKLKTDRVISLALAVWLATDGKPKVEKIEFIQAHDW